MFVIGVDPGLTGALAAVDSEGPRLLSVLDMPVVTLGKTRLVDGARVLDWIESLPAKPDVIVIEEVSAMPRQGVASTFVFGTGFGGVGSVVLAAGCRVNLVRPAIWKKRARLGRDKQASFDRARLLFGPRPEFARKKDHGRAEAALIAYFGCSG